MTKKLIATNQITISIVADGSDGKPGSNGISVINTDVMYAISNSNITAPALGDSSWKTTADTPTTSKPYVWSLTKTSYSSGNPTYTKPVCISSQGVLSITEEYASSIDKDKAPTTGWSTKQPIWNNNFIWTRSKIVYKNPQETVYTTPYCDSSWIAIEDMELGARNLLLNTAKSEEIISTGGANICGATYKLAVDYTNDIKNKKITYACEWEFEQVNAETPAIGTFHVQTGGPQYTSLSNTVTISPTNISGKIVYTTTKTLADVFVNINVRTDNMKGKLIIYKPRLYHGDKDLGWTAAPEDKIDADNIIGSINGSGEKEDDESPMQISFNKINIKGQVTFEHLKKNNDELGNIFTPENNKTVIDGGYIKTHSVKADKINIYELTVSKRINTGTIDNPVWKELANEDPTFMIAEDGNISASGTFKSFNFKEDPNSPDNNTGWMIDKNGNSIFNNTVIRGKVELPNAGVTNENIGANAIRFWAGESHAKRANAPFKVLQDGTIIASKGDFGGTFTGKLQIGNITIQDKVGTAGAPAWGIMEFKNDTNNKTIIRVGEDYSYFNSIVYYGTPNEYKMKIDPIGSAVSLENTNFQSKKANNDFLNINGANINFNNKYSITNGTTNDLTISTSSSKGTIMMKSTATNGDVDLKVTGEGHFTDGVVIGKMRIQPTPDLLGIDFFPIV